LFLAGKHKVSHGYSPADENAGSLTPFEMTMVLITGKFSNYAIRAFLGFPARENRNAGFLWITETCSARLTIGTRGFEPAFCRQKNKWNDLPNSSNG
jgi:hypothetical protein